MKSVFLRDSTLREGLELPGVELSLAKKLKIALMLEAMECRVERALIDLQDIPRDLLDALRDCPAVQRVGLQRPEDEQVERARQEVGYCMSSHSVECRH